MEIGNECAMNTMNFDVIHDCFALDLEIDIAVS